MNTKLAKQDKRLTCFKPKLRRFLKKRMSFCSLNKSKISYNPFYEKNKILP